MHRIFEYTSYRKYLEDFFIESKQKNPKFSHRYLASRLGITMPNLVQMVMQGKRKMSSNLCARIAKVMGLHRREADYFDNMVRFMQAKTHDQKNIYFLRMLKIRRGLRLKKIEERQYEYFSNWYNPVIRELVTYPDFRGNYKWLAKKLSPPITPDQARSSIDLLLRLGLIIKNGRKYRQRQALISTGPEVNSLAIVNFHRSVACLAAGSYDRNPKNEHNLTGCTLNLTKEHFDELVSEISFFRKRALSMADEPKLTSRVYQLNIQLFPVSKK
jgi:uncharacterized protein (TIGR02147 family)